MVMQKFQDEAKAKGIELPSVFTDLDPSSGMPAILKATTAEQAEKFVEKANEELQKQPVLKPVNLVDAAVQVKPKDKAEHVYNMYRPMAVHVQGVKQK